jgi:hypothetical protein
MANAWFDGVERHRAMQADVVRNFCDYQAQNARTLSDAEDGTQLVIRLLSLAAVGPLRLVALASELGGVAIDTHRGTLDLLEQHSEELTSQPAADAVVYERQSSSGDLQALGHELQMVD